MGQGRTRDGFSVMMGALGSHGGSSEIARSLADGLADRGHAVRICHMNVDASDPQRDVLLTRDRALYLERTLEIDRAFVGGLDHASQLVRAYDAAPFDLFHVHNVQVFGLAAYLLSQMRGVPYVVTMHGSDVLNDRLFDENRAVLRQILGGAAEITCVSRFLVDALARKMPELPRSTLVHNFIPREVDAQAAPSRRCRMRLIHVSSLREVKRPELLVSIFEQIAARVPEATLRIVTTRKGKRRASALLRSSPARSRVTIREAESDSAVLAEEYAQADLFLLTSRFESFGLVLLEALSYGVPAVAPAVAGIPEVLGADWPLLVPEDAPPSVYAETLESAERLLDLESFGKRRSEILGRFQRARQVDAYEAVYRRILSRGRGDECQE